MELFTVFGHENDLYFFYGRNDVTRCPRCGQLLRKWDENLRIVVIPPRLKLDVSYSYDGVVVVSPRFRHVYDSSDLTGLSFGELQNGYWWIRPQQAVKYDVEKRGTRFMLQCSECGIYKEVAGATPAFLVPPSNVGPMAFVRTDVEFGSGDEKSPLVICGEAAARVLQAADLSGLELEPVRQH
jgi:hypothetical protein